jgi:hypothetical protein
LSVTDARQTLSTLTDEYIRPWRQWETAPYRLYSRAAVRPIPTISARIEWATIGTGESDSFFAATIVIDKGPRSATIPCVVDRSTKRLTLFEDGQWLTEAEWLKTAPLP